MIKIICKNCGKHLEAPDGAEGQKGRCPECDAVFRIPSLDPLDGRTCPACRTVYPANTVICTYCGVNLEAGKKVPVAANMYCNMCEKNFEVSGGLAEKKGKCPECGGESTIPELPCPKCGSGNVNFLPSNAFPLFFLLIMVVSRMFLWLLEDGAGRSTINDLILAVLAIVYLLSLALLPFGILHWIIRKIKQGRNYTCQDCNTEYYTKNGKYFEPG